MEDNDGIRRPNYRLPERLFAFGEEPTGVRVTPYHKAGAIRSILNALDPEEIDHIRASPFSRLLEIADKPSFSGRFGRYIISRQLKVFKKHEAWFLFAGKPIRFSIREFALVTGLNCSKFPKRCKRKAKNFMGDVGEKPYWGELFGSIREVLVSSVVKMLRKKTVVDRETRLKYAYLSLLSSVILPTTHSPRISQEAAEMIKDFDAFFAYPWGRVSFEMLMSSIKERKEVALYQNTIALKGFVLALQLVIVECVHALTKVVQDGSSFGSDGEGGGDDDPLQLDKDGRKNISPGHARDTDAAGKAVVESIMLDGNGEITLAADYQWSDDEEDDAVSNMVGLVEQRFSFRNACFVGGATKEDVMRMHEESKAEMLNRKTVKSKTATSSQVQDGIDVDLLASMVRDKLKDDFQLLHGSAANVQESANGFTETILLNINDVFGIIQDTARQIKTMSEDIYAIMFANQSSTLPTADTNTSVNQLINKTGLEDGHAEECLHPCDVSDRLPPANTDNEQDFYLDPSLLFPNSTFSLGLTQEARVDPSTNANVTVHNEEDLCHEDNVDATVGDAGNVCRKSKRQKVPTKSLMGEYECDKGFQIRATKAVVDGIYKGGNVDYKAKFAALLEKMNTSFDLCIGSGHIQSSDLYDIVQRATQVSAKVVDVLMFHTSSLFRSPSSHKQQFGSVFMDTQFVSQFTKLYTKFSKVAKKDSYKFSGNVVDMFLQLPASADAVRFYFPFYLDKKYWVGICVDCST